MGLLPGISAFLFSGLGEADPAHANVGIDEATDDEEEGWRDARDAEYARDWECADLNPDDFVDDENGTEGEPGY